MAITAQEIAKASEAINRIKGLSPLARRLGIELIGRTDKRSGTCFPSEARLAVSLNCTERSIRRAKVDLQQRGFLTWKSRGRHKTPLYRIVWKALIAFCHEIKRHIKNTCAPMVPTPSQHQSAPAKPPEPVKQSLDRTFSSSYLSQILNIKRNFGKVGGVAPSTPNKITPEQAHKNAEKRFWVDLGKLPKETFIAITEALSIEQQERAVEAEKKSFGKGVSTILAELKYGEVA